MGTPAQASKEEKWLQLQTLKCDHAQTDRQVDSGHTVPQTAQPDRILPSSPIYRSGEKHNKVKCNTFCGGLV